ncbi:class I SAM-dependent methyltransferase [Thiovibrio frasassiensis]|uniref:Class I SAM-dependent methyltransferase n=1 Tax=Thiovibrio frasassiensis TaxID=2984131 RepID=A0A9X4MIN9_9BACT|nr:class I SAM-dependent methyltransferase [Thiovibrio frasassiensis]MDG4476605.1 class I SAM-dependent methyltransferase [Thiovibrio frasassiensis]
MTAVKTAFDEGAQTYDRARRQLIPCFDDFYGTALALIPHQPQATFRVLDLGAGTGMLSSLVAKKFAQTRITLLDISQEMLDKAKERFAGMEERLEFIAGDYANGLEGQFDVILSALSIHHLTDTQKIKLFKNIHNALPEGGIFINADQILGPTPDIEQVYQETWLRQARDLGVSEVDLNAALERMQADRMAPLSSQLEWLRQAGFSSVHCWYQQFRFAVFSGQKGKGCTNLPT